MPSSVVFEGFLTVTVSFRKPRQSAKPQLLLTPTSVRCGAAEGQANVDTTVVQHAVGARQHRRIELRVATCGVPLIAPGEPSVQATAPDAPAHVVVVVNDQPGYRAWIAGPSQIIGTTFQY